jgi:hypothetical protein
LIREGADSADPADPRGRFRAGDDGPWRHHLHAAFAQMPVLPRFGMVRGAGAGRKPAGQAAKAAKPAVRHRLLDRA